MNLTHQILSVGSVLLLCGCSNFSKSPSRSDDSSSSELTAGSIVAAGSASSAVTASKSSPTVDDTFPFPISGGLSRVTKKPFGIFITPATSPVQPEKFTGYHTGIDFETTIIEQKIDTVISSVCSGKVRFRGWVKGYGGVLVQECTFGSETVTVLYGHLNIDSVTLRSGDTLEKGTAIGILGAGGSTETDGERKHLHLGVHRGSTIEYRGYVSSETLLDQWINPYK